MILQQRIRECGIVHVNECSVKSIESGIVGCKYSDIGLLSDKFQEVVIVANKFIER